MVATTQNIKTLTMVAGEDLNGKLYHALSVSSTAAIKGQLEMTDAATDVVAAILYSDPGRTIAAGDVVTVMPIAGGGIGLVKANSAIAAGNLLIPTATDGEVADVANIAALGANQMAFGIALEDAVADQIFQFLAMPIAGPTA